MGASAVDAGRPGRLLSLDAFRGLTILGMIVVNNPGTWSHLYWPLGHAAWHGWTPTDLVFPFFLFIVGVSLAYSLRKYRTGAELDRAVYVRIFRRTAILFGLGLLLTLSGPLYEYLRGEADSPGFETWRIPGVLQRIALAYLAASLIVLHVGPRAQAAIGAALLLGYWAMLAWLPPGQDYATNLSPEGNVVRVIDRVVLGEAHMYTQATTEKTDPEGLLSTLPAIGTALMGYWTGLLIQRRGVNGRTVVLLVAGGLALAAAGQAWGLALPINKKLWTSSFVLLTGGLGMATLGACLAAFDIAGWRRAARALEIVGVNAIFVFVAASLTAMLLGRTTVATEAGSVSAHAWLYDNAFVAPLSNLTSDPRVPSLAFALATAAFWWIILWGMARRGWAIRV